VLVAKIIENIVPTLEGFKDLMKTINGDGYHKYVTLQAKGQANKSLVANCYPGFY